MTKALAEDRASLETAVLSVASCLEKLSSDGIESCQNRLSTAVDALRSCCGTSSWNSSTQHAEDAWSHACVLWVRQTAANTVVVFANSHFQQICELQFAYAPHHPALPCAERCSRCFPQWLYQQQQKCRVAGGVAASSGMSAAACSSAHRAAAGLPAAAAHQLLPQGGSTRECSSSELLSSHYV